MQYKQYVSNQIVSNYIIVQFCRMLSLLLPLERLCLTLKFDPSNQNIIVCSFLTELMANFNGEALNDKLIISRMVITFHL